jgi:hypothetical protein
MAASASPFVPGCRLRELASGVGPPAFSVCLFKVSLVSPTPHAKSHRDLYELASKARWGTGTVCCLYHTVPTTTSSTGRLVPRLQWVIIPLLPRWTSVVLLPFEAFRQTKWGYNVMQAASHTSPDLLLEVRCRYYLFQIYSRYTRKYF